MLNVKDVMADSLTYGRLLKMDDCTSVWDLILKTSKENA